MSLAKTDLEVAIHALDKILDQPIEEIELTDSIPPSNEITDSNKVFEGKLSILFADIRKSTDLTDELKSKKMVKIYRSFIRMVIQAIRYSGGYTRQFAGDGVIGVFQDSIGEEGSVTSSQKAVNAARYIHTLIDYCLNPALQKYFDDLSIGCGIGVCTGSIMITKVGMRGKESDESAENETGIVWVGSTTNYANRYCSLAFPCEIFVDENTYSELESSEIWKSTSRTKGSKVFTGYIASEYYLSLPNDFTQKAVKAELSGASSDSFIQEIFDETQERAMLLVDEISKKSAALSVAMEEVKRREQQVLAREKAAAEENLRLRNWQQRLDSKQASVDKKEADNRIEEYKIHCRLFSKTYLKNQIIKDCGINYWTDLINKAYELGRTIGKSKLEVQIDLDCYLVNIYLCFDLYGEAYDALCIQAEYSSWLSTYKLEEVVRKSGHWAKLKGILEKRVHDKKDYLDALQTLKTMGY